MIPESSANRDIALYRAVEFPLKWERHAVLVERRRGGRRDHRRA